MDNQPVPSRRRATIIDLCFSYTSLGLTLVRTLLLIPIYLKYIPFDEYGAWLASGGLLGYFTAMDLGITAVLGQQTAVAYGKGNREQLQRLLGTGLVLMAIVAVLPLLIGVAVSPWLPAWLHIQGPAGQTLRHAFLLVSGFTGLDLLGFAAGGMMRSFQRAAVPGITQLCADIASIACTLVLVVKGYGLYGIAGGMACRSVVVGLSSLAACLYFVLRKMKLRPKWSVETARNLFGMSVYQLGAVIAGRLVHYTDGLVVGMISGPVAAGMYTLTGRGLDLVRMLTAKIGVSLSPGLAHMHGEGKSDHFRRIVLVAGLFQLALMALGTGVMVVLNQPFMRLWVGPEKYAGLALTVLLGIWNIGTLLRGGVAWEAIYAVGQIRILTAVTWLEAVLRLPLMIGLLSLAPQKLYLVPVAGIFAQVVSMAALMARPFAQAINLDRRQALGLLWDMSLVLVVPFLVVPLASLILSKPLTWPMLVVHAIGLCLVGSVGVAIVQRKMVRQMVGAVVVRVGLSR